MMKFMAVVATVSFAAVASAGMVQFERVTNNAAENVQPQLQVEYTDLGSGQVKFRFTNDLSVAAASITDVYFDAAGVLDSISSINSSFGVSFGNGASPPNLPGGNGLADPFSANLSADSNPPSVAENGVNMAAEWLEIVVNLSTGVSAGDMVTALGDGSVRIGMHVQSIGADGESDAFVNTLIGTIPAPGAFALGLIGLGFLGGRRR